jgi:hypothetical protein
MQLQTTQTLPAKASLLDDLSTVSDSIRGYLSAQDDAILTTIIDRMNRKPTFWGGLFPDAFERERKKIVIDSFRTAYGHRRALINGFAETQIEIAKRRGDTLIISVGVSLQTKLAAFASEKLREFARTLIATKDDFLVQAQEHWKSIERYRDIPEIYEPARQDCIDEIRAILGCIQSLRENFTAALQAKVSVAGKER